MAAAPPHRARRVLAALGLALWAVVGTAAVAGAQEGESETETTEEHGEISHEAEECIHILEDGGKVDDCHEAPSPIIPETSELVWGLISFTTLLILMYKFAWPGIKKGMEGRTNRIRENLDEAERVKTEAETALAQYQRQIGDAKAEANRIIEEARQAADQVRRDLVTRAEAEVGELRQRARDEIAAAQQRASSELQGRVGALAIELAEKVVEANLDREANQRLVDNFISSVGNGTSR